MRNCEAHRFLKIQFEFVTISFYNILWLFDFRLPLRLREYQKQYCKHTAAIDLIYGTVLARSTICTYKRYCFHFIDEMELELHIAHTHILRRGTQIKSTQH